MKTIGIRRTLGSLIAISLLLSGCEAVVEKDASTSRAGGSGSGSDNPADLLPSDVVEDGKIVAVIGDYKEPTYFRDEDDRLVGLNVDIANALGEELGIEVETVVGTFDSALAGVQSGRYDTALYNMADTEERREVVDFVDYAVGGSVIVTGKGESSGIKDAQSLCGMSVAIKSGQAEQPLLEDESGKCEDGAKEPIDIQSYQDDGGMRQSVVTGRSDAMMGGAESLPWVVKQNPEQFEIAAAAVQHPHPTGLPFRKGREDLVAAIAAAFDELLDSGEFEDLTEKWGLEALVPEEITINGGDAQ